MLNYLVDSQTSSRSYKIFWGLIFSISFLRHDFVALKWSSLQKEFVVLSSEWFKVTTKLTSSSQYFIFFITFEWAQQAYAFDNTKPERLAREKHSSFMGFANMAPGLHFSCL